MHATRAKLIQKAHELSEVPTVVTPEGITAQVNKAVKHTKGSSQKYITIGRVGKEIKKTIEGKVYILIPRLNLRWLRMKYDNILRFKDKLVTIAYEHIFGIEVNPTANSAGVVRYNWSGLHNDFWNELKRDRIISLKNKAKSGTSGFYTAEVTYKGVTNKKTFFPSNWSPSEVVEKIIEAYKNFDGIPKLEGNGRFKIDSFTNEGIKIRIIIQENTSTAKIITAYPVLG